MTHYTAQSALCGLLWLSFRYRSPVDSTESIYLCKSSYHAYSMDAERTKLGDLPATATRQCFMQYFTQQFHGKMAHAIGSASNALLFSAAEARTVPQMQSHSHR